VISEDKVATITSPEFRENLLGPGKAPFFLDNIASQKDKIWFLTIDDTHHILEVSSRYSPGKVEITQMHHPDPVQCPWESRNLELHLGKFQVEGFVSCQPEEPPI
jgi:hypothetical protein